MGPMIGVMVSQEILMAYQCQAMADFELGCVKKFRAWPQTRAKTHIVCSHDTISVAAEQFHITPIGPMIGVMVYQEILMTHQCQAMTHFFELGCVKKFRAWPQT
jgi:predicted ester cyclase